MQKFYKAATLMFMSILFLTGCSKAPSNETSSVPDSLAETFPVSESISEEHSGSDSLFGEFTTLDIYGNTVNQDIFNQSDLTMLNIWGTFCGPCIQEMPDLGELSRKYADNMQIIGLISDVTQPNDETALEIIEYTNADYTHLIVSKDLMKGYLRQVQLIPTTVFLDKEGKQVGNVYTGTQTKEKWEKIIEEMLGTIES